MRDGKFGFLPRHSTSLQLACLLERTIRNFSEEANRRRFPRRDERFDTLWIVGLLYKLRILNFPSYLVHTISSYFRDRTFASSFQTATSSRRARGAGVTQGGLISPVLFSLYVNMPTPSHHVKLALYANDTAIIATSCWPTLLISCLEYLDLQRWSTELRIAINNSKSTAFLSPAPWRHAILFLMS